MLPGGFNRSIPGENKRILILPRILHFCCYNIYQFSTILILSLVFVIIRFSIMSRFIFLFIVYFMFKYVKYVK